MALFKKKSDEGTDEWKQTLVAEDEPVEGDSEFKFKLGKKEEDEDLEEEDVEQDEDDFFDAFDEDEPEDEYEDIPDEEEAVAGDEPETEWPATGDPWGGDEPAPEPEFGLEPATAVQHPPEERPDAQVISEPRWTPKHRTPINEIRKQIDKLDVGARQRPKNLDKWLEPRPTQEHEPLPGHGIELIPSNIRNKRIVYETEGGFVVEVEYREGGDLKTKYYTASNAPGRQKALASIKSGAYAQVTTVTDAMIAEASKRATKKTSKRGTPGKVTTWPIKHKTNVTDIEGVGDEYQARLKEIGYYTTDQLRLGNPKIIAAHVGVTENTVRRWQAQAELMLVSGVGKQLAELLARAGVDSIEALKKATPKRLSETVKGVQKDRKVRITTTGVGPKRAGNIIRAARKMQKRSQSFPELGPVN